MAENVKELASLEGLKYLAEKSAGEFAKKTAVEEISGKVAQLEEKGGEPNVIAQIKVNDEAQTVTGKSVNIKVPTKLSDLNNDKGYQTESEVTSAVTASINKFATELSENGQVDTFAELVNYVAEHGTQVTGMLSDINGNKESIRSLETLVGDESVAEQIDGKLEGYVQKDGEKVLSTNDYTDEDKEKLQGLTVASLESVKQMIDGIFAADEA